MKVMGGMCTYLIVIIFIQTLSGCGEEIEEESPSTVSYSGATNEATIDINNGHTIAIEANQGASTGAVFGEFAALKMANSNNYVLSSQPYLLLMAESVIDAIEQIDFSSTSGNSNIHALTQVTNSISGSCGGTAPYTVDIKDFLGDFSGTIDFSSFCSYGMDISGEVIFSGNLNLFTGKFTNISLEFNDLTLISGDDNFTMKGTMSFVTSTRRATMDMTMLDNTTLTESWINNYVMTVNKMGSNVYFTIYSGTFYHHEYGYVSLKTTVPILIYSYNEYPSRGVLICEGKSASKVKMTVNSSSDYTIEIDADGDDTYEDTNIYSWN